MATMKDVARLAGVSIATVSATVNGTAFVSPELRERVTEAIQRLGYAPDGVARSLKKGRTQLIGLIVADITNPFFTELVHVIEAAMQDAGYSVLLCDTDEDFDKERNYLRILQTHRVDGVILAPTGVGDAHQLAPAAEEDLLRQDARVFDPQSVNGRRAGGRDDRVRVEELGEGDRHVPRGPVKTGYPQGQLRSGQGRPDVQEQVVRFPNGNAVDRFDRVPRLEAGLPGRGPTLFGPPAPPPGYYYGQGYYYANGYFQPRNDYSRPPPPTAWVERRR